MSQSRIRKSFAIAALTALGLTGLGLGTTAAHAAPRTLVFADGNGGAVEVTVDDAATVAPEYAAATTPANHRWIVQADEFGNPIAVLVADENLSSKQYTNASTTIRTIVLADADGNPVEVTVADAYSPVSAAVQISADVPQYVVQADAEGNAVMVQIA
jgi:hypothetical protein